MSSTDESGREVLEIDDNGPAELLPRSFAHDARCTVGRPRNLLICRLFGFRDGPLVGLNATARDFTRFDCLSDEPSIRRTKLPRGGEADSRGRRTRPPAYRPSATQRTSRQSHNPLRAMALHARAERSTGAARESERSARNPATIPV